jgi:hypothetical protein
MEIIVQFGLFDLEFRPTKNTFLSRPRSRVRLRVSGPSYTRVEAGDSKTSVRQVARDVHPPNQLTGLRDFLNIRKIGSVNIHGHVKFNVAVRQNQGVATAIGIGRS